MSSEVELGKYRFADAPAATAGELFDAEFNRQMKVDNAIRSQEDIVKAFDDRSDAIKKTLGIDLPNPLRLPVTPPEYDAMGNVSKPGGQWVDHVADYTRQLKDLSDKHPEHSQVINASEPPDLMVARQKQALERKSADMQEAAGMIEGRKIPYLGKVPVVRDVAALSSNLVTRPAATISTFGGSLYAQMHDPVEAATNLLGFGAAKATNSLLKAALKNAAANATIETAMQPLRQENRKNAGLEYGWEQALAGIEGAAAAGFVLDMGIRGPARAALKTFGKDVPAGEMFSKRGRGGFALDAIENVEPIKPIVRENVTPDEIKRAEAGDIDAIESIATKRGIIEDPVVKGAIDHQRYVGPVTDAMIKNMEKMGIDRGEGMNLLDQAIRIGNHGYVRTPDPVPAAKIDLDPVGAAELMPRLAEIETKLQNAPENVRAAVQQGLDAGLPEIVKAARAALSGDLDAIGKAFDEAGGPDVVRDRVILHTSRNPVEVAAAIRRTPGIVDSTISLETDFMRSARAIAALDEAAFEAVARREVPLEVAALVANNVPPGQHMATIENMKGVKSVQDAHALLDVARPDEPVSTVSDGVSRVSDPAGPEAKAQTEALEAAHKTEVEAATANGKRREELETKIETLRGEIAKMEDEAFLLPPQQAKVKSLSEADRKLIDKLSDRTGMTLEELAALRMETQSFGSKVDAVLDRVNATQKTDDATIGPDLAKRAELRTLERELESLQLEQASTLKDDALYRLVIDRAHRQRALDVQRSINDALDLADKVLPADTRIDIRPDEMRDPVSGQLLDATSDATTGNIALATYALNPAGRIGHEGVHTLVTKGHISPEELQLLASLAREKGVFKNEDLYRKAYADRENLQGLLDEEAAAHVVEARINGEDFGPANTMLDRIKQVIERVKNALNGYGFKTADDVVNAILNGEMAARDARAEWGRALKQELADADISAIATKGDRLYAFAGEKAKTADLDALARAKSLEADGTERTRIWKDTGWFRGVDGKWRFEIDDSKARLLFDPESPVGFDDMLLDAGNDGIPLDKFIRHPAALKAYRRFGDVVVTPEQQRGVSGMWHGDSDEISIDPGMSAREIRATALHEMQHGMQMYEQWFTGDKFSQDNDFATYIKLASEVEARAVEKRMDLTPEQRRNRAPWLDYDVPEVDQIIYDTDTGRSMKDALYAIRDNFFDPNELPSMPPPSPITQHLKPIPGEIPKTNQSWRISGSGGEVEGNRVMPGTDVSIEHSYVPSALRGEGVGLNLYRDFIDGAHFRGMSVSSDKIVSVAALRIYDALERRGYPIRRNPDTVVATNVDEPSVTTRDGSPVVSVGPAPWARYAIRDPGRARDVLDRAAKMDAFDPGFSFRNLIDPQIKTPGFIPKEPFALSDVRIAGRSVGEVPLKSVKTIQKSVSLQVVKDKINQPDGDIPSVFKFGNMYYVNDGNHRIAAAKARGLDTITAEVIELQPKETPAADPARQTDTAAQRRSSRQDNPALKEDRQGDLYAVRSEPKPLDTDMAFVGRMSELSDLVAACRG